MSVLDIRHTDLLFLRNLNKAFWDGELKGAPWIELWKSSHPVLTCQNSFRSLTSYRAEKYSAGRILPAEATLLRVKQRLKERKPFQTKALANLHFNPFHWSTEKSSNYSCLHSNYLWDGQDPPAFVRSCIPGGAEAVAQQMFLDYNFGHPWPLARMGGACGSWGPSTPGGPRFPTFII